MSKDHDDNDLHRNGELPEDPFKGDEWEDRKPVPRAPPVGVENHTRATRAAHLILDRVCELFRTSKGVPYAVHPVGEHRECHPVRGHAFRTWAAGIVFEAEGKAIAGSSLADALEVVAARALYESPMCEVFVRVAAHDGRWYIDLADADWRAVEVSPDGWRVVDEPPVRFQRKPGALPLPDPVRGGSVAELRPLVNVADEDWPLLLTWLVAALSPIGPYPVLALFGEQGSAKSTTARVCRRLVDPNEASLRSEPREVRDLMIAANNGHVIVLDNVSALSAWLSDALCRLATGSGFAVRTNYSDDEETILTARLPVIVTAIEHVVVRSDLLDRALVLTCPTIPPTRRRTEREHEAEFAKAAPRVFGALLDALSVALRRIPETRLENLPRMADFATLAVAAESALGLEAGAVLRALDASRADARGAILDASPIAGPIRALVETDPWEGTARELLDKLNERVPEPDRKSRSWPKTPKALADQVRRIAPDLRAVGVNVELWRAPGGRRDRMLSLGGPPTGTQPGRTRDAASNVDSPENKGFGSHGTHGTQVSLLGSDA